MTAFELKNADPDDIRDWLSKVEKSFDIQIKDNELLHVTSFGQICDLITDKIQLDNSDSCTSQQAFYKLRDAIASILQTDDKTISPDSSLTNILPRQSRHSMIKELEDYLGFDLNILQPPRWITRTLMIVFLSSVAGLFFNWQTGLLGIVLSISALWLANKAGNELNLQTVGQVAVKMTRENYVKSRRKPNTFNKKEIEKILISWFSDSLQIDKNRLPGEMKFV